MDYKQSHHLTKWILILPIIGLIITSFLFIQTFIGYQKELYDNEVQYQNIQTIKQNKLLAKEKIEEIDNFIRVYTQQMKLEAKRESKEMIGFAIKVIEKTHKKYQYLPRRELLKIIANKLSDMRFFKHLDGYFYLFETNGTCLMHPITPSLIGQDLNQVRDIYKEQFVQEALQQLQQRSHVDLEYYWRKGTSKKVVKKYAYFEKYAPLNLVIATGRYEDNLKRDIKESIQQILLNLRYGKNGYIFAYDGKGETIAHITKEYIGVNRWDVKIHDEYLIRQLIQGAKLNPEGFFKSYLWVNPWTQQDGYKTSYIKYIPDLDWIIGTGVYRSDINAQFIEKKQYLNQKFDETILKLIFFSVIILSIVLLLTYIVFTKLRKNLKKYQYDLIESNLKTEEKKEQLVYQLRHDILTGLPNRMMLLERLDEAMLRAQRHEKKIAVLFLDIDNFKGINDQYGHDAGDAILKEFATRITSRLRKSDMAARLSGDEFILVIEEVNDEQEVITIINKIKDELMEPIIYHNIEHQIQVSIGISFYPDHGNDFESLIKKADNAMYESKNRGKNEYTFYII